MTNFTQFCRKTEVCRDFAFCRVLLVAYMLDIVGKLFTFTLKRGKLVINHIIVASVDVWQSYLAHTFCKVHFMLFCCEFTFVAINFKNLRNAL